MTSRSTGLAAALGPLLVAGLAAAAPAPPRTAPPSAAKPAPPPAAPATATFSFPFEGTWIRADRPCTAKATLVRTYTAHEVVSSRSRCAIRRVVGGSSGQFEIVEDCRHSPPPKVTETIRMLSADQFTLKRQVTRLKIPHPVRFARCTAAAPDLTHPR